MLSDLAGDISNTITNQMERLETALTSKKSRHERLGQHGLSKRECHVSHGFFHRFFGLSFSFGKFNFQFQHPLRHLRPALSLSLVILELVMRLMVMSI